MYRLQGYRDAQCGWLEVPRDHVAWRLRKLRRRVEAEDRTSQSAEPPSAESAQGEADRLVTSTVDRDCLVQSEQLCNELQGGAARRQVDLVLAMFAPHRQLVELWQARQGVLLLALAGVGASSRLLQAHHPLAGQGCFVFDSARRTITNLGDLLEAHGRD